MDRKAEKAQQHRLVIIIIIINFMRMLMMMTIIMMILTVRNCDEVARRPFEGLRAIIATLTTAPQK